VKTAEKLETIRLIRATFFKEEETKRKLADFILQADKLSMGQECQFFERKFAEKQNRKHAVLFNSGSSANLALIQALRNLSLIRVGDDVGVSSVTWSTNVMPLIQLGLNPIPVDCEIETLNVSLAQIKKHGENFSAIFLTNVLGFCGDIDEIAEYCQANGILLLEDNCESLGTVYKGKLLGNFSLASTFSFYVAHHLSTVEGGMICTDDDKLYNMLKVVRAHGWTRDTTFSDALGSTHDDFYGRFRFFDLGYNLRPTEITGFLGREQMNYWDEVVACRAKNYARFEACLQDNPDTIKIRADHLDVNSNFAVPVVLKNESLFQQYIELFMENSVEIRPIVAGNIEEQPFFKKYVPKREKRCVNADFIHKHGFYFSNDPEMTEDEILRLCSLISR